MQKKHNSLVHEDYLERQEDLQMKKADENSTSVVMKCVESYSISARSADRIKGSIRLRRKATH